jgi:hypothetical protein
MGKMYSPRPNEYWGRRDLPPRPIHYPQKKPTKREVRKARGG